jgi:hypothetical protein
MNARDNDVKKSKIGRPPVDTEAVTVRMQRSVLDRLDTWRAAQRPIPTRPDAIRHFVEVGIEAMHDPQND